MKLPEKLKAPIKLGTASPRSGVTFLHEEHFAELDCSNCHPDVFNIKKKGTEAFTMESNIVRYFLWGLPHKGGLSHAGMPPL